MPNVHTTLAGLFADIADAIRLKTGGSADIIADSFPSAIAGIPQGGGLEALNNPATADRILYGYEAYDDNADVLTGTVVTGSTGAVIKTYGTSHALGVLSLSGMFSGEAKEHEEE